MFSPRVASAKAGTGSETSTLLYLMTAPALGRLEPKKSRGETQRKSLGTERSPKERGLHSLSLSSCGV